MKAEITFETTSYFPQKYILLFYFALYKFGRSVFIKQLSEEIDTVIALNVFKIPEKFSVHIYPVIYIRTVINV